MKKSKNEETAAKDRTIVKMITHNEEIARLHLSRKQEIRANVFL